MKRVSVIVPVRDNAAGLESLLSALVNQTFPQEAYEVIVVDNGSRDSTAAVARRYEQSHPGLVRVLIEASRANSYLARNIGIRNSTGEVIAMIDSDCMPVKGWIEAGVRALAAADVDLAGGKITWIQPPQPESAQLFDELVHLQNDRSIDAFGRTPTANLFVKRSVIDAQGLFPTHARSGVDGLWTETASKAGFKLVYVLEAEVLHPTRRFAELMKKHIRLGSGQPAAWAGRRRRPAEIVMLLFRNMLPMRPRDLHALIRERGRPAMQEHFWSIWWVAWCARLATNLGRVQSMLRIGSG